ncbi:UDP-glucose 4-epimerase GalE [soil metagenome]
MVSDNNTVLVAGGAGYIGSHTAKALAGAGYPVVVFDNLSSGFREAAKFGAFVHGDIRDVDALREAMTEHKVGAVIHFASLIEVGRSTVRPDLFYEHNVTGTATLLKAMRDCDVRRLVFSSSAAVYGHSEAATLKEGDLKDPVSPYGDTKYACERMIASYCRAFGLKAVALRYFNAAGADASGELGEAHDPETHLIPLAIRAGLGLGKPLTVFGDDFPTPDGTCLRDYIHVADLASAHVKALSAPVSNDGFEAVNVGTGRGWSVLEVIKSVEKALGQPVPHSIGGRRDGDPAQLVADASRAKAVLDWTPERAALDDIVASAARWHKDQKYGRVPAPFVG